METAKQIDTCATFEVGNLKLQLFWDGATQGGKCRLDYEMTIDGNVIASGNDFLIGMAMYPDSIESVVSLLGFLTVQKGDTDESYFANHTPEHLNWLTTSQCQEIALFVADYEDSSSEGHAGANEFFSKTVIIG